MPQNVPVFCTISTVNSDDFPKQRQATRLYKRKQCVLWEVENLNVGIESLKETL
jgi:hypothetical protein